MNGSTMEGQGGSWRCRRIRPNLRSVSQQNSFMNPKLPPDGTLPPSKFKLVIVIDPKRRWWSDGNDLIRRKVACHWQAFCFYIWAFLMVLSSSHFSWSRPSEVSVPLGTLENRCPCLFASWLGLVATTPGPGKTRLDMTRDS